MTSTRASPPTPLPPPVASFCCHVWEDGAGGVLSLESAAFTATVGLAGPWV